MKNLLKSLKNNKVYSYQIHLREYLLNELLKKGFIQEKQLIHNNGYFYPKETQIDFSEFMNPWVLQYIAQLYTKTKYSF